MSGVRICKDFVEFLQDHQSQQIIVGLISSSLELYNPCGEIKSFSTVFHMR